MRLELEAFWNEIAPQGEGLDADRATALLLRTVKRYEAALLRIAAKLGEQKALIEHRQKTGQEVTESDRQRWFASLHTAHIAAEALERPALTTALRMLFDWLVVGHVMESNPAHAVRGPKYSQKKGKTPVLDREEARALIATIDTSSLTGLRDRALIGVMVYTFARVSAVLNMNMVDYFSQGRRGWVRLHEKDGKEHEAPCIPKLETYLDEYIAAAGSGDDKDGPLFRTTGRSTGTPHRMTQQDAYRMIQRRAAQAGIKTRIGNHSMRATEITDYLKSDGSLSEARKMANHADTRTTQLYDRRGDAASLDEYGKVGI